MAIERTGPKAIEPKGRMEPTKGAERPPAKSGGKPGASLARLEGETQTPHLGQPEITPFSQSPRFERSIPPSESVPPIVTDPPVRTASTGPGDEPTSEPPVAKPGGRAIHPPNEPSTPAEDGGRPPLPPKLATEPVAEPTAVEAYTRPPQERPEEFARIERLGYPVPEISAIPPFREVYETLEIHPLRADRVRADTFAILEDLGAAVDTPPEEYISVAAEVLRKSDFPEDALSYATEIAIPSLMALHADHAESGYRDMVQRFVDSVRAPERLHTIETLRAETARAIDFVEHRPETIAAVNEVFDDWMQARRAGEIQSNAVGIIQFGSYPRGDATYTSDVDVAVVSDGEVSDVDYEAFKDYIREQFNQRGLPVTLGVWRNRADSPTFPIVQLRESLEEAQIDTADPGFRPRVVAVNDTAREMIETALIPLGERDAESTRNSAAIEERYPEKGQIYNEHIEGPLADISDRFPQEVRSRLLRGETSLDDSVLARLGEISDAAQVNPNEFVAQAREELRTFFTQGPIPNADQILRDKGVSLILYGSLQYGDPRNVDVDLFAVVNERPSEAEVAEIESTLWRLGNELENHWVQLSPFQGRERGYPAFGHLTYYLSDFADVDTLLENNSQDYLGVNPTDLAPIISGVPLFPQDREQVTLLRQRARQIAESDPLLNAVTNVELADTFAERLARRR